MSLWNRIVRHAHSESYLLKNYRYVVAGAGTVSRSFYYKEDAEAHRLLWHLYLPELGPYWVEHRDTGGK